MQERKLIKKLEKKKERMIKSMYGCKIARFVIALQKIFHRDQHLRDVEMILEFLEGEITGDNKELVDSLKIRRLQLKAEAIDRMYRLHSNHHLRDITTTLAVLKKEKDAKEYLENMPHNEDRPYSVGH